MSAVGDRKFRFKFPLVFRVCADGHYPYLLDNTLSLHFILPHKAYKLV